MKGLMHDLFYEYTIQQKYIYRWPQKKKRKKEIKGKNSYEYFSIKGTDLSVANK